MPDGAQQQVPGQPPQAPQYGGPPLGPGQQQPPAGYGGFPPPAPGQQGPYGPAPGYGPQSPYGQQPGYGPQPPFGPPPMGQQPMGPPPFGPPPQKPNRVGLYVFLGCLGVAALIGIIFLAVHGLASSSSSSSSPAVATGSAPAQPSASSAGASSAASSSAAGGTGSVGASYTVQDNSGDTYRVTLVKIIDPAQGANSFYTPGAGKRFIGAVFTITAIKGSPQNEDANLDAAVVGSNGQSYSADFSQIAGYTDFSYGEIKVTQGQSVTGAVTFQIPTSVNASRIQWTPGGFGNTVQWNAG